MSKKRKWMCSAPLIAMTKVIEAAVKIDYYSDAFCEIPTSHRMW